MHFRDYLNLLGETWTHWNEAKAQRLGASLACYAVISLAPLLVLILALAGLVFGPKAAAGALGEEIGGMVGEPVAKALQDMIQEAQRPWPSILATVSGLAVLLFGASGVFAELQDAMNTIWQVAPRSGRGLRGLIFDRFLSFAMVMSICFLLLVSLVVSTGLAALDRLWSPEALPGGVWAWRLVNIVITFCAITVLFGLIFKVLPDARVRWRDVGIGAVVTALLFTLGKYLLGVYVSMAAVTSGYGAAGSLVVVLLWVYYSSQLVLFGATFTRTYTLHFGGGIQPAAHAVLLTPLDRAQQGIPTAQELERAQRPR